MTDASTFLRSRVGAIRRPLALVFSLSFLGTVLMAVQYLILAEALNTVIFADGTLAQVRPQLWAILAIIAGRALLTWAGDAMAATAAATVRHQVRVDLLARLAVLGPVRLAGRAAGELASLLVDGVDALEPYYARFLPAMMRVALVPPVLLLAVFPLDWLSGLVLLLTAPLIPVAMIMIGKGAEALNQRQWVRLARLGAYFLEVIQGLTTLKLFNASKREAEVVARLSEDYRQATMAVLRVAFLSALALEFFATLGVALVAVLVGFRLLEGHLGFTRGFFVLLVAPEFFLPLRTLGTQYHARMEAIGVAGDMAELLAELDAPPATPAIAVPAAALSGVLPAIRFQDVRLRYADGRLGLDGADFTLAPGTVTALVGPSGAGKSSVVSCLLGFIPPTAGEIRIDDQPLAHLDLGVWREKIAWVPQRPHLLPGTVADNIRLGRPDADDAAVRLAACRVGADAVIAGLEGGYAHAVGENGQGLSGGQARLIALARAALRDAPLLILDEPTASLDRASEARVSAAMRVLAAGTAGEYESAGTAGAGGIPRTVLVVAHRLETVRAADLILVMDRGRVVERGNHATLMALNGLYADLVRNGEVVAAAPIAPAGQEVAPCI